jgi:coenzyme F420-reducing hydrogenase beta subunit
MKQVKNGSLTDAQLLFNSVIRNKYCIGCGLCASNNDSPYEMRWDKYGLLSPVPICDLSDCKNLLTYNCPFSETAKKEDEISDIYFPDCKLSNREIGRYLNCYAGYVIDEPFRKTGTSGGFSKWIAYNLLSNGITNYHIHVVPANDEDGKVLFKYQVVTDPSDIVSSGAKSAYYPVSLDKVISFIKDNSGKYSITALPCFAKALRLYSINNPVAGERIQIIIGTICGSLKSSNYARSIAWQMGIAPDNIKDIDFRVKMEGKQADCQGNKVWPKDGSASRLKTNRELFGLDYGMGFFKPAACDFCDDVVAETADVSCGDAWLPEYNDDSAGTSILVVRNGLINSLLQEAALQNRIFIEEVEPESVLKSQAGSFRHRREGLSYRLYQKKKQGKWVPPKRVDPVAQSNLLPERMRIFKLRQIISAKSHSAFFKALKTKDLDVFIQAMIPYVRKYYSKTPFSIFLLNLNSGFRVFLKRTRLYRLISKLYKLIK